MAEDTPIPELNPTLVPSGDNNQKEPAIEGSMGNPKPQMKHLIDHCNRFNEELRLTNMKKAVRELTTRKE